jgi:hypothetical protein
VNAASLQPDIHAGAQTAQENARLDLELSTLRARMNAAYCDKLDSKIPEEFWQRRQTGWQEEEVTETGQN